MEGVTYAMRDSLAIIRELGVPVKQIRASGGGSKSPLWRQMQADVFGQDVVTINADEGPAYGVALLAAVGAGAFKNIDEACAATIRVVSKTTAEQEGGQGYDAASRLSAAVSIATGGLRGYCWSVIFGSTRQPWERTGKRAERCLAAAFAGAVAVWLHFKVSDQQEINYLHRIVWLAHEQRSAARNRHDEFLVQHGNRASISQMDHKRLERPGMVERADLLNRHGCTEAGCTESEAWLKTNYTSASRQRVN